MDVDSIAKIVLGWLIKKALDWLATHLEASDAMSDIGLQRAIRRTFIGMLGSVVLCGFAVLVILEIAVKPSATGSDAVAAALAVGLFAACAITYKRRREQWKQRRKMAARAKHQVDSSRR